MKVLISKNTLRMPLQCNDWQYSTVYKGATKTNWASNTKRAAKRGVCRVYKPDANNVIKLVARI